MTSLDGRSALEAAYPDARLLTEAGITYVYIPKLKFETGGSTMEMEALLCPQQHGGYTTRLFLSHQVPGRGGNWSTFGILGKQWHTWSWNNVSANRPWLEILANHLCALR